MNDLLHIVSWRLITNLKITLPTLKGTVPPDFSPLVFFFKQLPLAPVDKPSNDFDFFRIFAEIFDFSGALPGSARQIYGSILLQMA
jgi:hypothetical protein